MNQINPFALSGLWILITYLPLTILVATKGRNKISFVFTLHMISIMIWGLGAYIAATMTNPKDALIAWRFAECGVIFIPIFFHHAVLLLTNRNSRVILPIVYLQGFFFLIANCKGKLISTTHYMFNSIYYKSASPLFLYFFVIWLIVVFLAHLELYKYYIKCGEFEKKFIRGQFLSLASFIFGGTSFLPAFGINLYPLGNFIVPIHSFCVTYAIFKHQLFDIKIVIRKSIVYSIVVLFLSFMYFVLIYFCQKVFILFFGSKSTLLSALSAFAFGIAFFPIHNKVQQFADQLFFNKTPQEFYDENLLLKAELTKSEKMKTISTLASSIAHEVKNPLTALKTFFEYYPQKKNDLQFQEKFEKIGKSEINRIENILNDLLTFAKPSPLTLTDTDINKTLQHALNLTSNQLKKNNIELKTEFADHLPLIKADANKLIQVFINLILNAIDAMPSGGVLTIASRFTDDVSRDRVSIAIADTGCGIPKENLSKIFDPFFSTKDTGTGLGLAIVKGIIEEHGGKISVKSNQDQGTTFTITLLTQEVQA